MQVTILPKITLDKPSKERIFQLIRVFLYTVGFVGIILHLNEYDNMVFQSLKGRQSGYALLFFMLILMTMQKVRFINWQSLAVTVVYAPIAWLRVQPVLGSADLLPGTILAQITFWMALMVITDMVVTGRVRKFKEMNAWLAIFFALMVGALMLSREGRDWPVMYLYFLIMIFIPVDEEEWGRVLSGLLNGGLIAFILVVILSLKLNPSVSLVSDRSQKAAGRWYGYFLNIGTFGQFIGLETALAFISIIRVKDKFGRIRIGYLISWLWFAAALILSVFCGTINYFVGLLFFMVAIIAFGLRKTKFPVLAIRLLVIATIILAGGLLALSAVNHIIDAGYSEEAVKTVLQHTPLRLYPMGLNSIAGRMEYFRNLDNPGAEFITSPLLVFAYRLSSNRLGLWKHFLEASTFTGTNGAGIQVDSYFAYNAHNQYVQVLYEQGFLSGGLNILFFVFGWIVSIVNYVKTKKEIFFVPVALLSMMFGMWVGEGSSICFALTFLSLFVLMASVMFSTKDPSAEAEENDERREKTKTIGKSAGIAAIVILSIVCVILSVLIVRKVVASNQKSIRDGEYYVAIADNPDEVVVDNGLLSSEDLLNGNTEGTILTDWETVKSKASKAAWGGKAYLAIPVVKSAKEDKLILEFTAESGSATPIECIVNYDGKKTKVEIDRDKSRYYVPLEGVDYDGYMVLCFELDDATEPVTFSNICIADYGQDVLLSSLKTGEYSPTEYDIQTVTADDKMPKAASAVAVGQYVYAVGSGELKVYRGNSLTEVGALKGLGDTQDICASENGKLLLITSKGSGVFFVDISSPDKPELISEYSTLEHAFSADISGNYAYICNRYFGVEVVDISDAKNPKYITRIQSDDDAEYRDAFVSNGYLYTSAYFQSRVDVYDIHSLDNVSRSVSLETDGTPYGLAVKDNILYVATSKNSNLDAAYAGLAKYSTGAACGMEIYDISHPDYPILLTKERIDGRINVYPQIICDVTIDGNYAYLSMLSGGLYVYDVSDPGKPNRISVVNISADNNSKLFKEQDPEKVLLNYDYTKEVRGNITHTTVGGAGVFCVSPDMGLFAAPINLKELGAPDRGEQPTVGDIQEPEIESLEGYSLQVLHPEGTVYALDSIEDRQFVAACGSTGLKVMDKQMHTICSLETKHAVTDVKVVGDYVYSAEMNGGFAIYRYENGLLTELGRAEDIAWNAYFESLQVSGDGSWVLVQSGNGRYRLIDCTDPENPSFIKSPTEDGTGSTLYRNLSAGIVSGKYLGIAGSSRILWFTESGKDTETGKVTLSYCKDDTKAALNEWNGMAPLGDACIVFTGKGYRIIHPEKGDVIAEVEDEKWADRGKPVTEGNKVIISDAHKGIITIADFTDKSSPEVLLELDTPYITDIPCVMDGEIYVPLRHDGILKITKN